MIMDVGLMLVFPLEILVRFMRMFYGCMVVLVGMFCDQVFHFPITASFGVMRYMDVLMAMDHSLMGMVFKPGSGHLKTSFNLASGWRLLLAILLAPGR
ncbi:MAG TPA: hypothetical protein VFA32_19770 [Dehalococcoidia bacterium]|nr:hypothetical protein [Dehalococcoidia bacterium]